MASRRAHGLLGSPRNYHISARNANATDLRRRARHQHDGVYGNFTENDRGTLLPGMLADVVVLSRGILAAAPEKILSMQADLTLRGGSVLFDKIKERVVWRPLTRTKSTPRQNVDALVIETLINIGFLVFVLLPGINHAGG